MNENGEIIIKVKLIHGEPISFKGKRSASEQRNLGSRIEAAMNSSYLGVELRGKLHIVPFHNVESIEISPAPDSLIKAVVRDVEPV